MRDGVFEGGQRGQLSSQLPKLLGARHAPRKSRGARHGYKRREARPSEPTRTRKERTAAQETRRPQEGEGPTGPKQRPRVRIQSGREGREEPARADLPSAAFPNFQGDAGV